MKKRILIAIFCIPLFGIAQTTKEKQVTDQSWNFSVTPYLWMTSLKGDMTVLRNNIPVDAKFNDDIISNLKMAAMVHAEAKHNRLSIMLDAFYAKLGADGQLQDKIDTDHSVRLRIKQTIIEGGLGYSFAKVNGFTLDALAGVRYFNVNLETEFDGNEISERDFNFVEPYVGMRFQNVWNKWMLAGRIDAGGFGAGSEISYKYNALLAYQFTDLFGLSLGYQAYKPNYQDTLFKYNVGNEGFLLGFNFNF